MQYLPHSPDKGRERLGLSRFESLDESIRSTLSLSVDDSSIHTSDYYSSSTDGESVECGERCDTPIQTRPLPKRFRLDGAGDSLDTTTHESSNEWLDVSDSSSEECNSNLTGVLHTVWHSNSQVARRSQVVRGKRSIAIPEMSEEKGQLRKTHIGCQGESSRLRHVTYVAKLDMASTNRELSAIGCIAIGDALEAFQHEVPHEIPLDYDDDVSSIGAASQTTPIQNLEPSISRQDLEKGEHIQLHPRMHYREIPTPAVNECKESWISSKRNELELFFMGTITFSLIILVILLVLMVKQR
jgi:hypothetical protein